MNHIFSKIKSAKGMTLVEVLVVAAILGVVVMAVMSLFIPSVQNTAIQTEVSDVQSNLRLAIDRMTDDLLTAGFLIGDSDPIINNDATGFTIRTTLVGSGFGRVTTASGDKITLAQEAMLTSFPQGSSLRLFSPAEPGTGSDQIYEVKSVDSDDIELTIDPTINASIGTENLVAVSVMPNSPNAVQTIRYQLEDGALSRTVNGQKQFLARGIENVLFEYPNRRQVNITLTGQTEERVVNGAPTRKTRELRTSVTLRNTF